MNTYNVTYLSNLGSAKVEKGMVITSDDPSYNAPAENLIKHGEWRDNSVGPSAYVQRPPGMGLLHLLAFAISPSNYQIVHKCNHVLMHFLSVLLFGLIVSQLFQVRLAVFMQLFFAIVPCFWGYVFYYLSESVTPFILLVILWGYVQFKSNPSNQWLLVQAMFAGLLLLFRPQLGIFIIPTLYCCWQLIRKKPNNQWHIFVMAMVILFGGFTLWQLRSLKILGTWPGVHPIYHASNQSQYRPVHHSFGKLYKIWEHNSEKFHSHMLLIWDNYDQDSAIVHNNISKIISEIPEKIRAELKEDELAGIFYQYHLITVDVRGGKYVNESQGEISLRKRIDSHVRNLKSTCWKENYFYTPLNSAKFLFTKSQLNLDIFQHKFRGQWWMEGIRYFCILFIGGSLLLTFWGLLRIRSDLYVLFGAACFIYVGYLLFIQKMNEERYLFPLLPIIFILGVGAIIGKNKSRMW